MTQISIGTDRVDVENVSFARRLDVLIREAESESEGTLREVVQDFEFGDKEQGNWFLTNWPDGVEVKIHPDHQNRPHRPQIPKDVVEKLKEVVETEYPQVPVEEYSFNELLKLYLDRVEEYYQYHKCKLVGENYKGPVQSDR